MYVPLPTLPPRPLCGLAARRRRRPLRNRRAGRDPLVVTVSAPILIPIHVTVADGGVRGSRTAETHATAEGLEPLSYPDYPESLSTGAAREFVVEFERACQHNRFLAEGFIGGTDTVIVDAGVPDGFVVEDDGGYLVGVTASIATEDNRVPGGTATTTPTPAPSYDDEFAA